MIWFLFASVLVNFILIFLIVWMWPYLKPVLLASLGDKNIGIIFDSNNKIQMSSLHREGSIITFENPLYKWIKNSHVGAYHWGSLAAEVIYKQTGLVTEADFTAATNKLSEWGFQYYDDVANFLTSLINITNGRPDPTGQTVQTISRIREITGDYGEYDTITDLLAAHPELDFTIAYPLIGFVDLKAVARYYDTTPAQIGSAIEQARASYAKIFADGAKSAIKPMNSGLLFIIMGVVIIGAIILFAVMGGS